MSNSKADKNFERACMFHARPKSDMGRARASQNHSAYVSILFQEIYRVDMVICFSPGLNLLETNLRFG